MGRRLTRIYPLCCQSAYCGKSDCTGCVNKPIHDEFMAWVEKHKAEVVDPIWSPCVFVSTVNPDERGRA